jgi:hypothetical protein
VYSYDTTCLTCKHSFVADAQVHVILRFAPHYVESVTAKLADDVLHCNMLEQSALCSSGARALRADVQTVIVSYSRPVGIACDLVILISSVFQHCVATVTAHATARSVHTSSMMHCHCINVVGRQLIAVLSLITDNAQHPKL